MGLERRQMKRLGLRAKLLLGMFLILGVSIGLVAAQAVFLFQEDKSAYVFDLNASEAIRLADEIQMNVRHLVDKMKIFADAIKLEAPEGVNQRMVLQSLLRKYPEFLLFSRREADGSLHRIFHSPTLQEAGVSVAALHGAYATGGGIPFQELRPDQPFIARFTPSRTLDSFTLAVRTDSGATGQDEGVLVAECPISHLLATQGASKLYEIYITDSSGTPFFHAGVEGATREDGDSTRASIFAELLPTSARTAGTREYDSSGVPMLAAYSPVGNLGLWTIVQIPKARAFEAARRLVTRSLVLAGVVCLAAIGLVLIFAASITRPLITLIRATEQIGKGQFAVQLPATGRDEIGALGKRFNRMGVELAAREKALKDANERLIESEKMTALGQLGAGIAHEVKNPLTAIRGYAQMGVRKVPADNPLAEYFKTIEKETGRSLEILKNLLKFSRQETAEMAPTDLGAVVTDTVKLVTHQLYMRKVEMIFRPCEEPLQVNGSGNQLEQVLLNLCMNASDAMEGGGTVTVTTDIHEGSARIRVADTGSGIPKDVVSKIFNPFFTTKPVGKGTGLGLSVSYGIIKEHKGEITVESEEGKGTTFTIMIPMAEKTEIPNAAEEKPQRQRVINLR